MAKVTTDQKIDFLLKEMKAQNKALGLLQKEFLSQRNEIRTLKNDVSSVKSDVGSLKSDVKNIKNETVGLKQSIRDLRKEMYEQFDGWDKKFFDFKSQIHDLIDNGFSSKAREHNDAIEILNVRTTEIREDIEKLNNTVFPQ
jgi:chromosome segregation ATPase